MRLTQFLYLFYFSLALAAYLLLPVAATGHPAFPPDSPEQIMDTPPSVVNFSEVMAVIDAERPAELEGLVFVRVWVNERGEYQRHEVLAATEQFLSWFCEQKIKLFQFQAAVQDGMAVKGWTDIRLEFVKRIASDEEPSEPVASARLLRNADPAPLVNPAASAETYRPLHAASLRTLSNLLPTEPLPKTLLPLWGITLELPQSPAIYIEQDFSDLATIPAQHKTISLSLPVLVQAGTPIDLPKAAPQYIALDFGELQPVMGEPKEASLSLPVLVQAGTPIDLPKAAPQYIALDFGELQTIETAPLAPMIVSDLPKAPPVSLLLPQSTTVYVDRDVSGLIRVKNLVLETPGLQDRVLVQGGIPLPSPVSRNPYIDLDMSELTPLSQHEFVPDLGPGIEAPSLLLDKVSILPQPYIALGFAMLGPVSDRQFPVRIANTPASPGSVLIPLPESPRPNLTADEYADKGTGMGEGLVPATFPDAGMSEALPPTMHFFVQETIYPLNMVGIMAAIPYPETAKKMGLSGTVRFRLLIDEEGRYVDHELLNELPHLTPLCESQLPSVQYPPLYREGRAVPFWVELDFQFDLVKGGPTDCFYQQHVVTDDVFSY